MTERQRIWCLRLKEIFYKLPSPGLSFTFGQEIHFSYFANH